MRPIAVAAIAVALIATACDRKPAAAPRPGTPEPTATGSGEQPSSATGSGSAIATSSSPSARPSPSVFPPDASVLSVAIQDPASLDPMRLADPGGELVARQLYEGLTRWDPVAQKVRPAVAKSWKVRAGGRKFTFKLTSSLFHNGQQVTAQDFKFAFDRIAQKKNASDLAYTLERVRGFNEVNQLGTARKLSGIETPNKHTIVFDLTEPYRAFPVVLTHPGLVPLLPSEVRHTSRFLSAPVGNGPFQMAQTWSSGQPVVLKAFTEFTPTPRLDGIEFLPYSDASASWLPYLNGAIDVAEVPAGQISAAAKVYGDQGYQPFLAGYYFGLNVASPALKDLHFRKAIDRAIDRKRIASKIYKGTLQPPRGIVPQGMPGFQENVCFKLCDYSSSAARRLVHKVPKKKRKVRLEYTLGPPHGAVAKAVKKDLEAVGIRVTVKGYGFKPYLRKLRTGDQEMYRLGWIAEYPDPDVFLSSLFASSSPDNHSGFSSSKVDKMLAKARAEPIQGVRVQDYIAAEKAILKHAPIVPIGSFVTHWAAQRYVDGIQFDQMGGFDAGRVSIAAH